MINPRKGTETEPDPLSTGMNHVKDDKSPKGDGNSLFLFHWSGFLLVKDDKSPKGDGNKDQEQHSRMGDTVKDDKSPKGDGNSSIKFPIYFHFLR